MTQAPVVVVGGGIIGSAIARQLQRSGVETFLVERDLEPQGVLVASLAPDDGQVDAAVAVSRLREEFVAAGGSLRIGRVSLRFGERDLYVRVATEELRAAKVVLATGAETHGLLDKLGWEVPVDARPGMLVSTESLDPVVSGTVYFYPSEGPAVHLRQMGDGRVVIGEWSQEHDASEVTQEHGRELLDQAALCFSSLARAKLHRVPAGSSRRYADHRAASGHELFVCGGHPFRSNARTRTVPPGNSGADRRPAGDSTAAMPAGTLLPGPLRYIRIR